MKPRDCALRPALGDDFEASVEAHAVRAVGMKVAEQRALLVTEAVVGDRHRHVDADHAHLNPVGDRRAASPSRVKMQVPLPFHVR